MIYRLTIWVNNEEHWAYEFFGSPADAKRRYDELVDGGKDPKLIEIDDHKPTPKNKQQILALLNEWASHSCNG